MSEHASQIELFGNTPTSLSPGDHASSTFVSPSSIGSVVMFKRNFNSLLAGC
jgi:hypothetical protein